MLCWFRRKGPTHTLTRAQGMLRPPSNLPIRFFPTTCRVLSTVQTAPTFTEETDLLIIGSGAGALTANLTAKSHGLRTILIEKQPTIGGASAISGGGLWIPCNPVSAGCGIKDSPDAVLQYLAAAVGNVGSASSIARRKAFVTHGPEMVSFLSKLGFKFMFTRGYPDYYPDLPGAMGKGGGRSIESVPFDVKKLGQWEEKLPAPIMPVAISTGDAALFTRMMSSPKALFQAMGKLVPLVLKTLAGQRLASMGRGLVAQLLYLNLQNGASDIRLQTSLSKLIQGSNGEVLGAEVKSLSPSTSTTTTIRAIHGILLAAGGFAQNPQMRQQYLPSLSTTSWTSSPKSDTGDAITEGIRIGALTSLMDDAWWGPTILDPVNFKPHFTLMERCLPHAFIVDSTGKRFMNEAKSYTDAGHDMYERNNVEGVTAIPAWLVMDENYRKRYSLGRLMARQRPSQEALDKKMIFMADSLEELAEEIGVDPTGLVETTKRYNGMSAKGVDEDFGKGRYAYNQFFGDPAVRPNSNMGPLTRPPYYAIAIWPGDLGTKGGLLTDDFQRVLGQDEEHIPGLFAIGNTAASIMGRTYLGAGSTLGPAMTHGFIAANFVGTRSRN
ncbi:3-ketosteroid 1-dehydrogenase helE [Aspergillus stella-maris]|uniref:3-ketosteroid 1-dehydrogenase helE n=1 Tax=Aspergillus stella-maris TaxID=1810926 RepID=UPI003CCDA178